MPDAPIACGIDFGTSTCLAAAYEFGISHIVTDPDSPPNIYSPWTPSLVSQSSDDPAASELRLLVGWECVNLFEEPQTIRDVKRALGDPTRTFKLCGEQYSVEEIAATLLSHLRHRTERHLGRPVRDVVLSIPANFGGAARQALLAAVKMAGVNPLCLINEPTAAALSYTVENPESTEKLLVFDFGGGTLDVTVLEKSGRQIRVRNSYGDPALGGRDFDLAIAAWIRDRIRELHPGLQERADLAGILRREAEQAKWRLSETAETSLPIGYIGRKQDKDVMLSLRLDRRHFADLVRPLLDRARNCLERALAESRLGVDEIDRVLLVGGTVKIPAVRELLEEVFPGRCLMFDPVTAVAEGAALLAANRLGVIQDRGRLELRDVASHGLGIRVQRHLGAPDEYSCLIAPNQEIPCQQEPKGYALQTPEQTSMEIDLYEGYTIGIRPIDSSYTLLRSESISGIPKSEDGHPRQVEITFCYDENAVLNLEARVA